MRTMALLPFFLLSVLVMGCSRDVAAKQEKPGIGSPARQEAGPIKPPPTSVEILQKSDNPEDLANAAISLCGSPDPRDVDKLVDFLKDPKVLDRMDSDEAYRADPWRFGKVLVALAKLPDHRGETALVTLMASDAFMGKYRRETRLMEAVAEIRNPSRAFLDDLEKQARTRKITAKQLIPALAKMRSVEACKRMETWLNSLTEPFDKVVMVYCFIEVRNEPGIVSVCRGMLTKGVDDLLRNIVVEMLFADHPMDGVAHPSEPAPKPPPRYQASTEILEELLKIAHLCSTLELRDDTRKGVKKARHQIEGLLEFRRSGGPAHVAKLIAELDSNRYATRESARLALEKYRDLAEPGLRARLKGSLSIEAKRRIQEILLKLEAVTPEPESPPETGPTLAEALRLRILSLKKENEKEKKEKQK